MTGTEDSAADGAAGPVSDEKANPQTMPDKPGDDPRQDVEHEPDRIPRGNDGPAAG